jgi:hypothetical protein
MNKQEVKKGKEDMKQFKLTIKQGVNVFLSDGNHEISLGRLGGKTDNGVIVEIDTGKLKLWISKDIVEVVE